MDVANELLEIGIFLTNNGFVSILEANPRVFCDDD
jgi:hypothetical protein